MDEQEPPALREQRARMIERSLALRPEAIAAYREMMARTKAGQMQKADARRLTTARDILLRTGGIPKD